MAVKRPAVFFDKDGTLLKDVPYNVDPVLMEFTPGAEDCIRELQAGGYLLFVVTNQSGIARGLFTTADLKVSADALSAMFADAGAELAGFYSCPHLDGCVCRKPEPGLLLAAARDHDLDLERSWMVGDILEDCEAGRRASCRTILVRSAHPLVYNPGYPPDHTVDSLREVPDLVLARVAEQEKEFCFDCP
jgi:D-glycero-D-manno-heptose 1,7-bisphosphate phosphatase